MNKMLLLLLTILLLEFNPNTLASQSLAIYHKVQKEKTKKNILPPLTTVFCDFTESDTDCVKIIKKNAVKSLIDLFETDSLKFFTIAYSKFNNEVFFTSYPVNANDYKIVRGFGPVEFKKLKKQVDSAKLNYANLLDNTIASLARNKALKASCIIGSIEKAYDEFNRYDPTGATPVKLIIYSDMLEDCTSTLGHYDLEHEAYTASLNRLKGKTASISFAKFKNLETKIVVSSNRIRGGSEAQYREFWSRVFSMYGFKNQPILSSGQ